MLEDLLDYEHGARIQCDLVVVGAGAAGITLVRQLRGHGLDICLLESGGLDYDAASQQLADGPNSGADYYPLVESRLRFFGGTTNIWGGRCSRYEEGDFARRDWVTGSGWPLSAADLEPYYTLAARDFALGPGAASASGWHDDAARLFAVDDYFVSRRWYFDDFRERFSAAHCADVLRAPDIRVLLHANVTHVQASADAAEIVGLRLQTLGGKRFELSARSYVLACGGIENARLLLASDDIERNGIGNACDQVGRYFMEHPHGRAGRLSLRCGFDLWAAFQRRRLAGGERVAPVLLPSPALQREEGILNSAFSFKLQRDPALGLSLRKRLYNQLKHQLAPKRSNRRLWHHYRDLRKLIQRHLRQPIERARFARGLTQVNVMVRGEQAPNPDSRVLLINDRDALGVRRAALRWRYSEIEKRTVAVMGTRLGRALERAGIGTFAPAEWLRDAAPEWPVDATIGNHPIGGYHHLGTTRMSATPAAGVVGPDCRVHGYVNLYIAGSSVFPTSSWTNPTLTIVALARRLGEHLLHHAPR